MPKRILLKISGEILGGSHYGFCSQSIDNIVQEIISAYREYEIAIVVGGGNIFRGTQASDLDIDPILADQMGMMGTVLNGLALSSLLRRKFQVDVNIMSSIRIGEFIDAYHRERALEALKEKKIVIFVAGTGHPLFTTDTAAVLRAREIGADLLLKATKVDGVYSRDPLKDHFANKYKLLHYLDILQKDLNVMDKTAITLSMEGALPLCVFQLKHKGSLLEAIQGKIGTLIN